MILLDPSGRVAAGAMRLVDVAIAAALVLIGLAALTWCTRRHPPGATQHAVTEDIIESQG